MLRCISRLWSIGLPLFALVCVFTGLSLLPAEQPKGKKVALVVGINKYHHADLNQPPLAFAEADAKELAELLKQSGYEVTLLTGEKATHKAIQNALDKLRNEPGDGGLFLVALAGHGLQPAGTKDSFFVPYDADKRVLRPEEKDELPWDTKTLLPLSEVLGHLQASSAGTRALLVDACRNDPSSGRGRGVGAGLKVGDLPKNTAVLLSCSEGQRAYEDKKWGGGHGAFFYQVLEGLKGKATDNKGRVTADELYKHVNDTVPDEVKTALGVEQKPFRLISGDVDLRIEPAGKELPKTVKLNLLEIEVLGDMTLKRIKGEDANFKQCYRIHEEKESRLLTRPEVVELIKKHAKESGLKSVVIRLYDDSPSRNVPKVSDLQDEVEVLTTPDGKRIEVTFAMIKEDAPLK